MCLAVPARIKRIDENLTAEVDLGGAGLMISLALTPEAEVGQYVIVHTGFSITVLDEEEALRTLELLGEMEQFARKAEGEEV